jgi:hypothetical protein
MLRVITTPVHAVSPTSAPAANDPNGPLGVLAVSYGIMINKSGLVDAIAQFMVMFPTD